MHPETMRGGTRNERGEHRLHSLHHCRTQIRRPVRAATKGPGWYQLYLLGGRAAEAALARAWAAGFTALFVTIDTGTAGMRERDIRNGTGQLMSGHYFGMLPHLAQFFTRPGWVASIFSMAASTHCQM